MLQSTISKLALCAAGGAVAAMTAAGPATAATASAPALPDGGGRVHVGWTKERTPVHTRPHPGSRVIDTLRAHYKVFIKCKVTNRSGTWYKLAKRHGWVRAHHVRTHAWIPRCTFTSWNSMDATTLPDFQSGSMAADQAGAPVG